MTEEITFKERVKNTAISEVINYYHIFVENRYLIFSSAFKQQKFYILAAEKDNYLHLIGVNTHLKAKDFFDKCLQGTLTEDDFDFTRPHYDIKSVKGSVRRKINCLPFLNNILESNDLVFDENFKKNNIVCALAASDGNATLGFTKGKESRPKTLLKGNELKNRIKVDLILSKKRNVDKFDKLIYGSKEMLKDNIDQLDSLISDSLKNI